MLLGFGVLGVFFSATLAVPYSQTYDIATINNNVEVYYQCDQGFQKIRGRCYHFSTTKASWFQAYDGCSKIGRSNLTVLTEKLDMRHLEEYFGKNRSRQLGHDKKSYWVASIKDWKQNKWIWYTSGKSVNFPDPVTEDPQNREWVCLAIDGTTKRWTAKKCFEPNHYVCQSEPVASVTFKICDKKNNCRRKIKDKRITIDKCRSTSHLATLTEKQKQKCQNLLRKMRNRKNPGGWVNDDSWNDGKFDPNVPAPVIMRDKPKKNPKKRTNQSDRNTNLLVCPFNWILLGRKCYKFSTEMRTWNGAYDKCKRNMSKLAIIKSKVQDDLIRMYLNGFKDRQELWIGGRFNDVKKQWIWAKTNEILRYNGFSDYALQNTTQISQWDGLTMDPRFAYEWNFSSVMTKKHYICQVKASAVKQLASPSRNPQATILIDGKK